MARTPSTERQRLGVGGAKLPQEFLEVADGGLVRLIVPDAIIERVAAGFRFTEGPLWLGDRLLFSDIPNNRTVCWRELPEGPEVTTFRTPTGNANGLTLDRQGRILRCEHSGRRVSRLEPSGEVVAIAERYQGKRLNSPNDVVVRSDGTVYFTDPPYGLRNQSEGREIPFNGVYKLSPSGDLEALLTDFERPNGLAFSPDESVLYVDDTFRHHIRSFPVRTDGTLGEGRVFAELRGVEPGGPDGMKVDVEGNIWCTGSGGIWVFDASGRKLGRVVFPELPANLAWGGSDWRTLYVTARTGLYRLGPLGVAGTPVR